MKLNGFWWSISTYTSDSDEGSVLLQPFDGSNTKCKYLVFEVQESTGDTSDSGMSEQLDNATPRLTDNLNYAKENGLMVLKLVK